MIEPNRKKQYEEEINPKIISAKEVLRELRRKKNSDSSKPASEQINSGSKSVNSTQSKNKSNKNSLLSPFLGRHVRYLIVVLALFFISIVSFTYTLVDTSSFDNRKLAETQSIPSLEFNSHSTSNSWKTICYLNDSSSCDLSFKTANVLAIEPVNLPNFIKLEFDYSSQKGSLKLDYGTVTSDVIDKPINISLDLISSAKDMNMIVNQQLVFTNGAYKDSNPSYAYTIDFFTGECTNFQQTTPTTKNFETLDQCQSYKDGMADNIYLSGSPSYIVNIQNVCDIDSSKTYKFEIPVEWSDSNDELSYIEVKDHNLSNYITPSFSDFRAGSVQSILKDKNNPASFNKKVVLGIEIPQESIFQNNVNIPVTIYYPNNKTLQKEFTLHVNFRVLSSNTEEANVDYSALVNNENSTLTLDLKYKLGCRVVLAKGELWDKYCSEYMGTIFPEKVFPTNVSNTYDYPLNTLQKGEYCVKIFVRNSSESSWRSFEIKNLSINSLKNSAPIILSKPYMTDLLGNQQLNYSVAYSDLENDSVEVRFVNKPTWAISSGNNITGIPDSKGSELISFQLKDSSGNLSSLQQFYVNSVANASNVVFDESELISQASEVQVAGNIKVKWSVSAYTTILKQEVYFAKVGNPYTLLATFNDATTSSLVFNTRDYSDGKYNFKIKAFLDDGETVEQVSTTYIFSNPVATSTSTAIVQPSVSSSTSTATATKTAVITSASTTNIATSQNNSTASTTSTEVSGSATLSAAISSATILDQLPVGGAVLKLSDLVISGKISFPEGKTYLDNSLKVFLNGEDISSICSISDNVYQCSKSDLISKLQNKTGLNKLEIAYSDNSQTIYNQNTSFELIDSGVTNSSSVSNVSSKISAVDEEKVLVLFGRKVPNFVLYGFISIIIILLLVFAIPWLLFFLSERKMNNKVKKLASI